MMVKDKGNLNLNHNKQNFKQIFIMLKDLFWQYLQS
jgi:hypothetical protein